jgi:hypothetical protein
MREDEDIVVIREDTGGGTLPGLLLGALIGAAIGLLRAPAPGQETREKLLKRLPGGKKQNASSTPETARPSPGVAERATTVASSPGVLKPSGTETDTVVVRPSSSNR